MTQIGMFRILRVLGILALAAVAYYVPGIGANHYLLAGILAFVCAPLAILLEIYFPVEQTGWSEPFFDIAMIVILVHLVPESWYLALLIGTLITGAAGASASRLGLHFYGLLIAIFISGMIFSAVVHDVDNWVVPIVVLFTVFPTISFYIYWEGVRSRLLQHRSESLHGLTLVAGGVAHDFNNILTIIQGNTELALEKLAENGDVSDELNLVVEGTGRAKMLTQQLLAFAGTDIEVSKIVDLESELKSMKILVEKALPAGCTLELEVSSGPFYVECHHAQIQQVLMNIIINAGEALTEHPAPIRLTLSRQASSQPDVAEWVVLTVRDEGAGISPELLPHIMDPFVSSKQAGRGLGLASVKHILDLHGGDIAIESQESVGTTVRLRLPAHDVRVETSEPCPAETQAAAEGLILVIDDEIGIRTIVCRQLERLNFTAISASDGEEGLHKFREHPEIMAVVLDLKMPGMDGWECLTAMRNVRPKISVVIISGYNPNDSSALAEISDVQVLSKPFRFAELRDAITAAIAS